ncbi:hypothetical protein [Pseudomonas pseudonitroreducens]|uniref:hypothetical protein n=1 Tax=Pseudomonas pseudonitroreducens TaxID=2892326 RepID=UPI001F2B9E22|nr:hypothetical protein [Pseudomonas pseudonitroreducens]
MNIGITLAGLLCMVCGVVGLARGERVVDTKGGIVARFIRLPAGWAKYMKWPYGIGLIMMGLILLGAGIVGWPNIPA